MPPILMLGLCAILVIILLRIERRSNPEASIALWIPTLYMLILGSRPLGNWFIYNANEASLEDGSPIDRWVLIGLIVLAVYILRKRSFKIGPILKDNLALLFLFLFLGISILWSDHTYVSLKRWIRLLAVVPIGIVVLTEENPLAAMESIFRRCAYILIPFSLILAKYYPAYGVSYSRWSGMLSWGGVTLGKNALAQLCMVSCMFMIWSLFKDRRLNNESRTKSTTIIDGFIFIIALYMLFGGPGGSSATSTTTFLIVIISLILMYKMKKSANKIALCIVIAAILMWPLAFFSEEMQTTIHHAVGRKADSTFTGRSDAWKMELEVAARNPFVGVGFGGFWGHDNEITNRYPGIGQTGHNGLLDASLEVGIVGVSLILLFLVSFYRRFIREMHSSFDSGVLGICFLIISIITNFTESLFIKSSSFTWNITIFLSIIFYVSPSDKAYHENVQSFNSSPVNNK